MTLLFRGEASARPGRLAGAIVLPALPGARLLAGVSAAACLAGGVFVVAVKLPETAIVSGTLAPEGGLIKVVAQQGGEIVELRRHEGDVVRGGDVIAVMTLSPHLPDGDSGRAVRDSFISEGAAARAEAESRRTTLLHERDGLLERRSSLGQELAETRNQLRISAEQWTLARSELDRSEDLAGRGYLTRRDLDARRVSALSAEARHSQMLNVVHSLERELSETTSRIAAIPLELATLEAEAHGRAAQLSQRVTEAAAHNGYLVVAPTAGRIVSSPIGAGNAAESGQTVAVLVPDGAALEAEIYLPLRAMGRIRVGQPGPYQISRLSLSGLRRRRGAGRGDLDHGGSGRGRRRRAALPRKGQARPVDDQHAGRRTRLAAGHEAAGRDHGRSPDAYPAPVPPPAVEMNLWRSWTI
jgi:membrane fusion protein